MDGSAYLQLRSDKRYDDFPGRYAPATSHLRGNREATMKLSVEVTGVQEQQLTEAARRLKVPEEELALAAVRDLLAHREADFDRAAAHVLAKNRELYRRLA